MPARTVPARGDVAASTSTPIRAWPAAVAGAPLPIPPRGNDPADAAVRLAALRARLEPPQPHPHSHHGDDDTAEHPPPPTSHPLPAHPAVIPADLLPPRDLEDARAYCDDACLRRFMRANAWDVNRAANKIRDTLLWRYEYRPHETTPDDLRSEAVRGDCFVNGFDLYGRPMCYVKQRNKPENVDLYIRLILFLLEEGIRRAPEGVEQVCLVADLGGYNMYNALPLATMRSAVHVLNNYYPERLGVAYVVNAPWFFGTLWSIISPFIDPVTRAKIRIVNYRAPAGLVSSDTASVKSAATSASAAPSPLLDTVHASMLLAEYGGDVRFAYNHDQCWEDAPETAPASAAG